MAATFSTTLGIRRAVNAFSHRELVGGLLLFALSCAAFAAAVLLPNSNKPIKAGTSASTDDPLIELCTTCDALTLRAEALWKGATRIADDDARDVALAHLANQQVQLLERLCKIYPTTAYGHAKRARTLLSWDKDTRWTQPADLEETLAAAVICDLAKSA